MAGDAQAALAAFLAVGISVLGSLIVGRAWLGPLLVIGSAVTLTLLLAPDAYVAIGLAFAGPWLADATRELGTQSRAAGASAG